MMSVIDSSILKQIICTRLYDFFFHVNARKTEYIRFNQAGDISTLEGTSLKLVDKFYYLESSVSSTKKRHRHAVNEGMDSCR